MSPIGDYGGLGLFVQSRAASSNVSLWPDLAPRWETMARFSPTLSHHRSSATEEALLAPGAHQTHVTAFCWLLNLVTT